MKRNPPSIRKVVTSWIGAVVAGQSQDIARTPDIRLLEYFGGTPVTRQSPHIQLPGDALNRFSR